jgi:hypothetical protein
MRAGDIVRVLLGCNGTLPGTPPFLRARLRAGDNCIYGVHATEPDAVLNAVDSKDVVDACVASEQLAVRPAMESYLQSGHSDQLLDYELALNDFVGRYPQMILCLYDISYLDGGSSSM